MKWKKQGWKYERKKLRIKKSYIASNSDIYIDFSGIYVKDVFFR